jgi:hypothetical protein
MTRAAAATTFSILYMVVKLGLSEHRLRLFENRGLRINGPKRDEVTAG